MPQPRASTAMRSRHQQLVQPGQRWRWRALGVCALAITAWLAGLLSPGLAHAQASTSTKLAADLQQVIDATSTPLLNRAGDKHSGTRLVNPDHYRTHHEPFHPLH